MSHATSVLTHAGSGRPAPVGGCVQVPRWRCAPRGSACLPGAPGTQIAWKVLLRRLERPEPFSCPGKPRGPLVSPPPFHGPLLLFMSVLGFSNSSVETPLSHLRGVRLRRSVWHRVVPAFPPGGGTSVRRKAVYSCFGVPLLSRSVHDLCPGTSWTGRAVGGLQRPDSRALANAGAGKPP